MSGKYQLNEADIDRWIANTKRFFAPIGLIYLAFVTANMQDGFTPEDLIPNMFMAGSIVTYVTNSFYDLFGKWKNEA